MSVTVRVAPQAAAQIRIANDWWVANRPKAPHALFDDVERAFDLISALPNVGEPVAHPRLEGIRRLLLGRVRYYLYYVKSEQGPVDVLAFWHTSRGDPAPIP